MRGLKAYDNNLDFISDWCQRIANISNYKHGILWDLTAHSWQDFNNESSCLSVHQCWIEVLMRKKFLNVTSFQLSC